MENPRSTSPSPYCHNYTSTDSVWNRPAEIQAICVPSSATANRRSEGIGPAMKILQAAALSVSVSVPGLFDECRDVGVQGLQIRFMGINHMARSVEVHLDVAPERA